MDVAKSVTTANGYNYFGCKVCNVRGIPYTSTTLTVHLQTRSHKIMKELYECGLWPGPADKYDYPERRIAIYKFLDTRGTLLCEACNKVMPDSMSLFKHQQSEEHRKVLKDKNMEIPMLYMCEVCDVFMTNLENYYTHCWSVEHHETAEKQKDKKKGEEKIKGEPSDGLQDVDPDSPDGSTKNGNNELALSDVSASDSSDSNHSSMDKLPTKQDKEAIQKLLDKFQQPTQKTSTSPVPVASAAATTRMTPPSSTAANAMDCQRIMKNFETPSFSPSSTISSMSQTPCSRSHQNSAGAQEASKPNIDPRLQHFLASISGAYQHQNVTQSASSTSVFEVLLKQPSETTTVTPENQMNVLLNRILYSNQAELQPKSEALNCLDHVLDVYIGRETNFLQVRQSKLVDLANLRSLIKESRDKNVEFEMSLSEIAKLTDIITNRLNTPLQEDPLAFLQTPHQQHPPQIKQPLQMPQQPLQMPQQQQVIIPQLQQPLVAPAAVGYQPNFNDLLLPLLAGFSSSQNPMSFTNGNELKPRFIKQAEFNYQPTNSSSNNKPEKLSYISKRGDSRKRSSRQAEIHERPSSKREMHERSSTRDRRSHERLSRRDSRERYLRRNRSRSRSSSRDRCHRHH